MDKKLSILFVCSGNTRYGRSPNVNFQAQGLINESVEVVFFDILGRGITGYIKNIKKLRQHLKINKYDVVHAHYGLSGMAAALAGAKPLIVTLMGSDIHLGCIINVLNRFFSRNYWDTTLIMSEMMRKRVRLPNALILSNGVDTSFFKQGNRDEARKTMDYPDKKVVVWVSHPERPEKNYPLAEAAFKLLNRNDVVLKPLFGMDAKALLLHYQAADVLLLTSFREGSPNVIKEAMACGLPIVTVPVGDVAEITQGLTGCYVVESKADLVAQAIEKAINEPIPTNGPELIKPYDIVEVSRQLISQYQKLVK